MTRRPHPHKTTFLSLITSSSRQANVILRLFARTINTLVDIPIDAKRFNHRLFFIVVTLIHIYS